MERFDHIMKYYTPNELVNKELYFDTGISGI